MASAIVAADVTGCVPLHQEPEQQVELLQDAAKTCAMVISFADEKMGSFTLSFKRNASGDLSEVTCSFPKNSKMEGAVIFCPAPKP